MTDGFLGRWSRRKIDAREGKPLAEPAPPAPVVPDTAARAPGAEVRPPSTLAAPEAVNSVAPEPPAPTLADAQALTPASDFKPFMAHGVAPEVKNAAVKKLFADPHFNVMDRLDIYIDDYSRPDPLPAAMLRQMASAQFLQLFDDEEQKAAVAPGLAGPPGDAPDAAAAREDADTSTAQDMAQSGVDPELPSPSADSLSLSGPEAAPATPEHAHAHLRLQPDHAPPAPSAGDGAE